MASAWGESWGAAWGSSWGQVAVDTVGSSISRGQFTRGQWRKYRDERDEEKNRELEARRRQDEQEKSAKEAARKAEKAAREAARQERQRELARKSAEIEALTFQQDAAGIQSRFAALQQASMDGIARQAMARQAAMKRAEELEEQEAVMLLMDS